MELLGCAGHVLEPVHAENHHCPFQVVEAEDVPAELLVVIVKGLPAFGDELGFERFLMG